MVKTSTNYDMNDFVGVYTSWGYEWEEECQGGLAMQLTDIIS